MLDKRWRERRSIVAATLLGLLAVAVLVFVVGQMALSAGCVPHPH